MKKIFVYLLIIFIIYIITTILFINKEEYKDRYYNYKNKYNNFNIKDIVTRVNIGLDYPFYTNTKVSNLLNSINIITNKYIYLPSSYIPNNLKEIDNKYALSDKYLVDEACNAFNDMAHSALSDGLHIRVISAYRSYDYQKNLYDNYVKKDGIEKADLYSARPGFSEHQTGLVIDIDNTIVNYEEFHTTKEYEWMINNSYKYGFILRYPKDKEDITGYNYESWHYRYVGKDIAKYIYQNNITFDEYYVMFLDK